MIFYFATLITVSFDIFCFDIYQNICTQNTLTLTLQEILMYLPRSLSILLISFRQLFMIIMKKNIIGTPAKSR